MKDSFKDGSSSFDGKIWAVLRGERGRTPELRLSNPWYDSNFDAGSVTSFYLTSYDIGAILSIDVRMVRSAFWMECKERKLPRSCLAWESIRCTMESITTSLNSDVPVAVARWTDCDGKQQHQGTIICPLDHPPLTQEKNGSSSELDLGRIEVTVDSTGAVSVFNCDQKIKDGAKAVNLPKFWVSCSIHRAESITGFTCPLPRP